MTQQPIILASTSPFRRELLQRLNLTFITANPQTDESRLPGEAPEALALRLSAAKAQAVAEQYPNALIIGSDQVAYLGDQIFGKPGTHANAVKQLQTMRGQCVNFYTGLCLFNAKSGALHTCGVATRVCFRDAQQISDATIEAYLQQEQPYQCAGSAKSEGLGVALIQSMDSSDPTALIGLPLIALCDLLIKENVSVL